MGYTKDEPVTITFGTLKQTQNESFQDGINFVRSQILYYLPASEERNKIVSFIGLLSNVELYGSGEEDECNCEENCGVDDCEAPEDDENCRCAECKDFA